MPRPWLILISLLGLLSTGCVEIDIRTRIQEGGSGTQHWRFSGTALLSSEIKKQVENNPFFQNSVIQDRFQGGDYVLEATIDFDDVKMLNNPDRDVRFQTEGWILKTHTYTEVWKRSGQTSGLLAQHARGVVPVSLIISVDLPGRIIETNADSKEGSVARWSMSVSELVTTKTLTAKSQSWNWRVLIPAGILILFGAGWIGYGFVTRSRREKPPTPPSISCPECGAAVPAGSAFCNFCGYRMSS